MKRGQASRSARTGSPIRSAHPAGRGLGGFLIVPVRARFGAFLRILDTEVVSSMQERTGFRTGIMEARSDPNNGCCREGET